MIDDITSSLQLEEPEIHAKSQHNNFEMEDLWSPKKVQPFINQDSCGNILSA